MSADCKIEIVDVAKRFPTDPPDMAPVLEGILSKWQRMNSWCFWGAADAARRPC